MEKFNAICALLLLTLYMLSSCKKETHGPPPTNCGMSVTPTQGYRLQIFSFFGCSNSAKYYVWNFGDGDSAIVATDSTTHMYGNPGVYNVSFTPFDSNGFGSTKTLSVSVRQPSWTFKSVKYIEQGAGLGVYYYTLSTQNKDTVIDLSVDFYNTLPPTTGTYISTPGTPASPNQINIGMSSTILFGNTIGAYQCTGGNGQQTVSVNNYGGVSITSTGIEMVNIYDPSDSAALILDLFINQ